MSEMDRVTAPSVAVGMVIIPTWRYVRRDGVVDADGMMLTHPVDVFLVMTDGQLVPVAYEPGRGTVYLEEEPEVVLLQTTAARVPAEGTV
jgi:hypothetical protein